MVPNPKDRSLEDTLRSYDEGSRLAVLMDAAGTNVPSEIALSLGNEMLGRSFSVEDAVHVMNEFDSISFRSSLEKYNAKELMVRWVELNKPGGRNHAEKHECSEFSVSNDNRFQPGKKLDAMLKAKLLLRGIDKLCQPDTYSIACKVLSSNPDSIGAEDDLLRFASQAPFYSALPPAVKEIYNGIIDRRIERNRSLPPGERQRFNDLGETVKNLHAFLEPHHPESYNLLRSVISKDPKNLLHGVFDFLAMPEETGKAVFAAVAGAIENIPAESSMDDRDVFKVCYFLRELRFAQAVHKSYELDCFFTIYSNNRARRPMAFYEYIAEKLDKATRARSESSAERDDFKKKERNKEKAKNLGLEYLYMSNEILKHHPAKRAVDFAERVKSFYSLSLGPELVVDAMRLYYDSVIMGIKLNPIEERRLEAIISMERKKTTKERDWRHALAAILKRGPKQCPESLRKHLMHEFGTDVEYYWDLRSNQAALYYGSAADTFEELSKKRGEKKVDFDFVEKVGIKLHESKSLESHILMVAGGCGSALTEIAFYSTLNRLGYDIHLDLIDKSPRMLEIASLNCLKAGIPVSIYDLNLETPNFTDFAKDRQMLLTLWGGTFFNMHDKYTVADAYGRIFARRSELAANHEIPRYFPEGELKRDILLVEGDVRKRLEYYRDRLSKLFIAQGLGEECNVGMDALTRDGRLLHTLFLDENAMEVQCIYLINKDVGPFKKNQAILAIDSGTMHKGPFATYMGLASLDTEFVDNDRNSQSVALCKIHF